MSKLNIITEHETEVDADGNPVKLGKADQYYEGRPTVTLSDGNTYEYHPHGIDAPQLLGNQLNHERQAESDAAWLESCSPAAKQKAALESANEAAKKELEKIDIESVRSIREYIAAQTDAPTYLMERENKAKQEREKIKG